MSTALGRSFISVVIPAHAGTQGHTRKTLHRHPRAKTPGPSGTLGAQGRWGWVAGSSPAMTDEGPVCVALGSRLRGDDVWGETDALH
jgi:hypothetical protein